ncbi:GNAT family acetyltransferase [Streptomyces sp. NPDC000994]
MTITSTLPRFPVSAVTERGLRLLPVAEPAILALADACGIGMSVSVLWLGVKVARTSTRS